MDLEELERAAGLDPDSRDYRLRQQLAEADNELIEHLVQLRKDKGLTQKVVARRMKRDVAAVSNFERLRADPHLSTIRRYAAAIGASITHLVVDAEAPSDNSFPDEKWGTGTSTSAEWKSVLQLLGQMDSNQCEQFLSHSSRAGQRKLLDELSDASVEQLRAFATMILANRGIRVETRRS